MIYSIILKKCNFINRLNYDKNKNSCIIFPLNVDAKGKMSDDFGKFTEGLEEAINKIKELKLEQGEEVVEKVASDYTDVDFDDLGDK